MKTMQKFLALIAALTMSLSIATVRVIVPDSLTAESDTEIAIEDAEKEEPDCQINCDKPIVEIDEKEEF